MNKKTKNKNNHTPTAGKYSVHSVKYFKEAFSRKVKILIAINF